MANKIKWNEADFKWNENPHIWNLVLEIVEAIENKKKECQKTTKTQRFLFSGIWGLEK